jgi:phage terminase large subunit-like protein
MWDLSCPDWEQRMRAGRSIIPSLPLHEAQARDGLAFYDEFRLPDAVADPDGLPARLGDATGEWWRDLVRVAFGSFDPVSNIRSIRDIFCMAPKGSSKTTYAAGLILAVMLMNRRRNCQAIFVGPTQSISDRAYEQAIGMITQDKAAERRFRMVDHEKTIIDRITNAEMKVKTFDVNILTGGILIFALVDELHLLGRNVHTTKVLRQIRGGLDKTPEGLLLITTTQSDEEPVGAFRDELIYARKIRDGAFRGQDIRPMLPVLYEFPPRIAKDPEQWQDPDNWPMVMPNLGRSVHLRDLVPDWRSEQEKGPRPAQIWASQHLNIEIGVGIHTDHWVGGDYWAQTAEKGLDLESLIKRCEVAVLGADGGGLDDLLGATVIGREKDTGRWLSWSRAWAHPIVLERRKSIATELQDLEKTGDLVFIEQIGDDVMAVADIAEQLADAGLLPAENAIGIDQIGIGQLPNELASRGFVHPRVVAITQGYRMQGAIKTTERELAAGNLLHADQQLMAWCIANCRVEPRGNAILITKQVSGTAKIDPVMAMFNAVALMSLNPAAAPEYQMIFLGAA